jgi:hypothetical protein
MGTAQATVVVERCDGATGCHVTGEALTGSDRVHMPGFPPRFFLTRVVVQNVVQ